MKIGRCVNGVNEFHVAYVIEVDLVLQHNDHTFPIKLYGENSCRKGKLADCRVPLTIVNTTDRDRLA